MARLSPYYYRAYRDDSLQSSNSTTCGSGSKAIPLSLQSLSGKEKGRIALPELWLSVPYLKEKIRDVFPFQTIIVLLGLATLFTRVYCKEKGRLSPISKTMFGKEIHFKPARRNRFV